MMLSVTHQHDVFKFLSVVRDWLPEPSGLAKIGSIPTQLLKAEESLLSARSWRFFLSSSNEKYLLPLFLLRAGFFFFGPLGLFFDQSVFLQESCFHCQFLLQSLFCFIWSIFILFQELNWVSCQASQFFTDDGPFLWIVVYMKHTVFLKRFMWQWIYMEALQWSSFVSSS